MHNGNMGGLKLHTAIPGTLPVTGRRNPQCTPLLVGPASISSLTIGLEVRKPEASYSPRSNKYKEPWSYCSDIKFPVKER